MRIETITRELYQFNELSDEAKEKAREWFREGLYYDSFEFDHVIDDAKEIAALMGIDIYNVYYSGFSSQGDGACFEGDYQYKKGSVKAVKDYAPMDKELHQIAETLQGIQKRAFYQLTASVKHRGHYSHSGCTSIGVEYYGDMYKEVKEEDGLIEALRDYMVWIYRQLDKQNDYINSNEYIDEAITVNEYEFTSEGLL